MQYIPHRQKNAKKDVTGFEVLLEWQKKQLMVMEAKLHNKDYSQSKEFFEFDDHRKKEVNEAIIMNFPMIYAIMEKTKSEMQVSNPKDRPYLNMNLNRGDSS